MGGQREYIKSGGFSEYLYHQVGETLSSNGVSGKVIENREMTDRIMVCLNIPTHPRYTLNWMMRRR